LRFWKFPEPIVLCQRACRDASGFQGPSALVDVCELARILSRMLSRAPETFYAPYEQAKRQMGLEESVVNDIMVRTFEQVQDLADSLRVEMHQQKDLLEIMEKANQVLCRISEEIFRPRRSLGTDSPPTFDTLRRGRVDRVDTLRAVAHEIRNPLLAVGGFARRLSASLAPDSSERRYAQIILEEALRLENALSKMTSNREISGS
jgi:signal transduction histidine kinase